MAPRRDSERARNERCHAGELFAEFSKRENDMIIGSPARPDGHLLHVALNHTPVTGGRSLVEELTARGYDLTTLRFAVMRKWSTGGRPDDSYVTNLASDATLPFAPDVIAMVAETVRRLGQDRDAERWSDEELAAKVQAFASAEHPARPLEIAYTAALSFMLLSRVMTAEQTKPDPVETKP